LAYLALAEAKQFKFRDGNPWSKKVEELLAQPHLGKATRMYLRYALARANEQEGNCKVAMEALDMANEIAYAMYNEGRPFDFEIGERITDRTIGLYQPQIFGKASAYGSQSSQPIFIVGMIRSGTTLLDQILSSHSMVGAAGETTFWMEESDRLFNRWRDGVLGEDLINLAQSYLHLLQSEAGDFPRITDKMPLNYQNIGHIHATFPKAKILHIRRNPIDTCLSIYATHFGSGPHFAYKKENIAFYYRQYLRLMDHWRAVLPKGTLFELDYEELVADRETVLREILAFCDLPWEPECLQHERNSSSITTPSRWQARQPIYKTSVDRWRRYEPWLGEFARLKEVSHGPLRRTVVNVGAA
jgi:hypothetical protein